MSTQAPSRTSLRPARAQPPPRPRLRDEDGVRYGLAHVWLALTVLAAVAVGLPAPVVLGLAAGVVVLAARGLASRSTAGLGLATWAVWTGFVEHRLGQLTLTSPDLLRMAAVVVTCLAASALPGPRWSRLDR